MSGDGGDGRGTTKRGARDTTGSVPRPPADRDLGHALRSVYGDTVKEDIPTELLDLLGRLD